MIRTFEIPSNLVEVCGASTANCAIATVLRTILYQKVFVGHDYIRFEVDGVYTNTNKLADWIQKYDLYKHSKKEENHPKSIRLYLDSNSKVAGISPAIKTPVFR